jgi:hypothetical protein
MFWDPIFTVTEKAVMDFSLYFAILTAMWAVIWSGGVWYLHTRRTRGPLWRRIGRKGRIAIIALSFVIPSVYCLSYPPLKGTLDDLFVPVQWLIDYTAIRQPLLSWAEICGISPERLIAESAARMPSTWGTTPPWLYASFWIAFGVACCAIPPYLIDRAAPLDRIRRLLLVGRKLCFKFCLWTTPRKT